MLSIVIISFTELKSTVSNGSITKQNELMRNRELTNRRGNINVFEIDTSR